MEMIKKQNGNNYYTPDELQCIRNLPGGPITRNIIENFADAPELQSDYENKYLRVYNRNLYRDLAYDAAIRLLNSETQEAHDLKIKILNDILYSHPDLMKDVLLQAVYREPEWFLQILGFEPGVSQDQWL
jgi:hypothetical protein